MKTAISLPDKLFKNAEKTAKNLGLSRSGLCAIALEEYLQSHNHSKITERLNHIYADENSNLEKDILIMQTKTIGKEDW